MYVAKIGERCNYSSTFSGIVPVKYIGLTGGHGHFGTNTRETFEVTKATGPYSKGERITEKSFVTPKKCFKRIGRFRYTSLPHQWEQKQAT